MILILLVIYKTYLDLKIQLIIMCSAKDVNIFLMLLQLFFTTLLNQIKKPNSFWKFLKFLKRYLNKVFKLKFMRHYFHN